MKRIVIVGVVVSKTTGLFVVKFIENQFKNADGFIILHQLHFANIFFIMIKDKKTCLLPVLKETSGQFLAVFVATVFLTLTKWFKCLNLTRE